jgi:hypothetical protein
MFATKQRCTRQNASSAVAPQLSDSGLSREAMCFRAAERKAAPHQQTGNLPVIGCLAQSSGQSLDKATRSAKESQLGHDFSKVRVHTGVEAAAAAKQLNARAFTVAKDIYFGAHAFSPGTVEGNRLLMHELVHTVQQSSGHNLAPQTSLDVSQSGDPAEVEADRIVNGLSSGMPATAVSPMPITAARKLISRAPLRTDGGEFEVKNYKETDTDKDNDTDKDVGAEIDIHFTPGVSIRSEKISFIQIIKPIENDKPGLFENEKARATPGGWALDRLKGRRSPNYGENNPVPPAVTGLAGPNTIFGKRTSKTDFIKAFMHDAYNVTRFKGKTSSADAKAFALNVTNGKYLGGITWGFDASAAGKVTKKNVEVFSMNNPTGEQAQALTKWNEQADFSGPDAAKKNAPDQEKVAEP